MSGLVNIPDKLARVIYYTLYVSLVGRKQEWGGGSREVAILPVTMVYHSCRGGATMEYYHGLPAPAFL